MTQMQSIKIAGIMNALSIANAGVYTSEMVEGEFDDENNPKQNSAGLWLNYTVMPESWPVDALETLLVVAEKLDYANLLRT